MTGPIYPYPVEPAPPVAPGIGRAGFAVVLVAVVLMSAPVALLPHPAVATWASLAMIPAGMVLLVYGRGRRHADRTITGCALVTVGLGFVVMFVYALALTVLGLLAGLWAMAFSNAPDTGTGGFLAAFNAVIAPTLLIEHRAVLFFVAFAAAGLILMAVPVLRSASVALARGLGLLGVGLCAVVLVMVLVPQHGSPPADITVVLLSAAPGVVLIVLAGLVWWRARRLGYQPRRGGAAPRTVPSGAGSRLR
ncbi:hypothetical protein H7J77_05780 [Mycolicibacillus parakoreensis]|uniref:DUF4190 domain-containing protein n=1 Tax=Mycolicibacillus parakoreensis TaxID=1069221 RepID=A0ABY3U363_9MYCO|nr:hypothetical protein [Mycolicibacillus parakoreensis]MCV7315046.1 hypothetical protein [Mycolicibacillus parakoreensis]ULN53599.1 hypothetical protein MIU77_04505 [Mycolicibacillus parakoreensis]